MKDNWIQPFQDKLGDYEFDLPAPQGRKIGWWVPLLAGAAAALLLMLLLRTPESRQQPATAFALADANPSLTLPVPAHPQDIRLIRRAAVPASVPTQPETGEPVTAPAEETPAEATPIPAEDVSVTPVNPTPDFTPVNATDSQPDDLSQWIPEEEEASARRGVTLSTKLYAGNVIFQGSSPQSADYQEFWDMRNEKASMIGLADNSYDFAANNLLEKAYHAYSVKNDQIKETVCDLPVKAGFSLQFGLSERLSLESGVIYSYHHSRQTLSGNLNGDYYYDYRLHYLGIPLKLDYAFVQTRHVAAYASLGGEAEILARGRIIPVDGLSLTSTVVKQHPLQFSLVGAAGAEYRFNHWLGIYAEPGVAYHFKPGGDLPNYYREHPWSFDLRIGLRFRIN